MIGVAAPCDYRPVHIEKDKIHKTGQPLELHLIETPDVVATLGAERRPVCSLAGQVSSSARNQQCVVLPPTAMIVCRPDALAGGSSPRSPRLFVV
jgi:hypothetical protein